MAAEPTGIRQKFDFYVVGLTFTLLAASIQTADFTGPSVRVLFELVAWVLLLIAAFHGLWRLELTSAALGHDANRDVFKQERLYLMEQQRDGVTEIRSANTESFDSIDDHIKNRSESIDRLTAEFNKIEARLVARYPLGRNSFLAGVSTLVLARAYEPAMLMITHACQLVAEFRQ